MSGKGRGPVDDRSEVQDVERGLEVERGFQPSWKANSLPSAQKEPPASALDPVYLEMTRGGIIKGSAAFGTRANPEDLNFKSKYNLKLYLEPSDFGAGNTQSPEPGGSEGGLNLNKHPILQTGDGMSARHISKEFADKKLESDPAKQNTERNEQKQELVYALKMAFKLGPKLKPPAPRPEAPRIRPTYRPGIDIPRRPN